jgi:hypothetical protein
MHPNNAYRLSGLDSQNPQAGRQTSKATTPMTIPWYPMRQSTISIMGKRTVSIKQKQKAILCQASSAVVMRLPAISVSFPTL